MNQISTAGQSTMNQIYAQSNKTKGVQTNIKDVNSVLEVIKKNTVQNKGSKEMMVQTDDSMVVLTQADYKKLMQGRHARGLSQVMGGKESLELIEEKAGDSISMSSASKSSQLQKGLNKIGSYINREDMKH